MSHFRVFTSPHFGLLLRAGGMAAKFLLVIFIGRHLDLAALGEYGLFVTTVTLAVYVLGLDFYAFSTREILSTSTTRKASMIRDQFAFHLLVYLFVLPLLISVFFLGVIPWKYLLFFYAVLIFEHISQEQFRLFTTLKQPAFANLLLFLRTGLWVYLVLLLWSFGPSGSKSLQTVWLGWLLGAMFSVVLGFFYLAKGYDFRETGKIDWTWIRSGVKVSLPFFIGTIAYKIIEFSDRYMIDFFVTREAVGAYTFFSNVANALNVAVFTLVIMIYYPKLVESYRAGKMKEFHELRRRFFRLTLLHASLTALFLAAAIWPIIAFMHKEALRESVDVFWLLLPANILLNLSLVPHYVLYSAGQDIIIRNATVIGAVTNVGLNLFMIPFFQIQGAAAATLTSFALIYWIKSHYAKQALKPYGRK